MRVMKMFRKMTLVALVLCLVLAAAAMADTNDFTFSLNANGNGYVVTAYNGSASSVENPAWYMGKPVTAIGAGAFKGNTSLVVVSMPDSVKDIGAQAFMNCTSLKDVTYYQASATPPRLAGDVNADGTVDVKDALRVLQSEAGWSVSVNTANADVNGNGGVDLDDAVLILQYCADSSVTLK